MTLTVSTPLLSKGTFTASQFTAAVTSHKPRTAYSNAEVRQIGERIIHWCNIFGFNHDLVMAQCIHETDWFRFTGDVRFGQHNFAGLGATGGVPGHSFPLRNGLVKDDGIEAGVLAVVAHHAVYRWGAKNKWPAHLRQYAGEHVDPRYDEVLSTGNAGKMIVLGDYRGTWAVPGRTYPESLIQRSKQIAVFPSGEEPGVSLTDTIAQRIRDKGVEVHDIRSTMVKHKTDRYRRLPNTAWLYTAVHHTAVSRGVRSLQGDIDSWRGHSAYHVNTHGWPGIAYAIGVSLSGRVFILRDIEEEGYHAFAANNNSIGICGDLTTGNTITAAFRKSLAAVLEVLHAAPEFPNLKDRAGTFGHQELAFVDQRNSGTACPGDLLPLVREYRAGVDIPHKPPGEIPPAQPDPWKRSDYWILNAFVDEIRKHDWLRAGICQSEAFREGDKVVQYFERARLELHPDNSVHWGLVGSELMALRYPERKIT